MVAELALAEAAALGEFFAVAPPPVEPGLPGWLPLTALATDPAVLLDRVTRSQAALGGGAVDLRVAASIVSLDVFARLLAPAFGAVCVAGLLPVFTLESLWWQPVSASSVRLAGAPPHIRRMRDSADYAETVVAGLVLPVLAAFERLGVSPVVLIGNVASALGGAAVMVGTARPELAAVAWRLVGELLDDPVLAGTATIDPGGRSLRRNSCCLFYRVPGGGYCGDCVLRGR